MEKVKVHVQKTEEGKDLTLPRYMTEGSAGIDLCAAVEDTIAIEPGRYKLIPTGIKIALPPGYEAQIRPRSGLAFKYGVTLLNTPGTVDSDYRGEIKVILINHGSKKFLVSRGDRIAQMVVQSCPRVIFEESGELPSTGRDDGGFGHTGEK